MIALCCVYNIPPCLRPEHVRDLRALWAAEERGVPYEVRWLDAAADENAGAPYRAINPFGTVPALVDGEFRLFESGAIVRYLMDDEHTMSPRERALYDQWCFTAVSTVEPAVFELMLLTLFYADAGWAKERAPRARERAQERLVQLDAALSGRQHLLGETFSGADILMGHVLNFVIDASLFEAAPGARAYHARLRARPAYERARQAQLAKPTAP